jgi:hypothetical protein
LKNYINYYQNDWVRLLSAYEYYYNNNINATTGKTPFSFCLIYTLFMQMNSNIEDNTLFGESPVVREEIEIKIKYTEKYTDLWRNAQKVAEKYYNKKHKKISFTLGDEILLRTKNLAIRKLYKKFLNRYVRFFQIFKKIGMNAYQLNLSKKYGRFYRIFHISLLELYTRRPDVAPAEFINVNGEDQYVVEAILDSREKKGKEQFLIK